MKKFIIILISVLVLSAFSGTSFGRLSFDGGFFMGGAGDPEGTPSTNYSDISSIVLISIVVWI